MSLTYVGTGTYVDPRGRLHIIAADLLVRAELPDTPQLRRRIGHAALDDLRDAGLKRLVVVHLSRRGLA